MHVTEDERCAVVRDLLPLYREQLVEPATEAFIQKHLAACSRCRALFDQTAEPDPATRAAAGGVPDEPPEPEVSTFLHRWTRRRRLAAAGAVVLAALAASAAIVEPRVVAGMQTRQLLSAMPGYRTARATGAWVPLARTVRVGSTTVHLTGYYATRFGSYLSFTASSSAGGLAAPTVNRMVPSTRSLADGSTIGYWFVSGLAPTYLATRARSHQPLSLTFRTYPGTAANTIALSIPGRAYRARGARWFQLPAVFHTGNVSLRMTRLQLSSAGAIVYGEVRGNPQALPVFAACTTGVGACAEVGGTSVTVPEGTAGGWTRFKMYSVPFSSPAYLHAKRINVPLKGLMLSVSHSVSGVLTRPAATLAGHPLALAGLPPGDSAMLTHLGTHSAQLHVAVREYSANQPVNAPLVLKWPGGQASGALVGNPSTSVFGDSSVVHTTVVFRFPHALPTTALEGRSLTISLHVVTLPLAQFPRGTVWSPRDQ